MTWSTHAANVRTAANNVTGNSTAAPANVSEYWTAIEEIVNAVDDLTQTEMGYLADVTPGTATASKALVLDGSKGIATITTGTITTLTSTTVNATTVDATTFTGASTVLESLNPLTVKLNDTNALQFDNAAISAFAAAADTAGVDVFVETQDGGADSAVDGANKGGDLSIKGGDAGAAGADQAGAAGGSLSIVAGAGTAGGAHTANNPNGGDGGDITLTVGAAGAAGSGGSGVAGDTGQVKVSGGCLLFANAQTIDMADAAVTLTRNPGTPTGTEIVSNVLFVDPNSGGAAENLLLPPEADCNGLVLTIVNTGGEAITVQNDAGGNPGGGAVEIATTEIGWAACDGTTWYAGVGTLT